MKKKFEEFVNNLVNKIEKYNDIYKELHQRLYGYDMVQDMIEVDLLHQEYDEKAGAVSWEISEDFDYLYANSIENKFFYTDCPFQVYEETFEERFKDFKKVSLDASLYDFIKQEVSDLNYLKGCRYLTNAQTKHTLNYHEFVSAKKYNVTVKKKFQYLSEILKTEGYYLNISEDAPIYDRYDEAPIGFGVLAEITKTNLNQTLDSVVQRKNQLTTNQIVLLLQEIGFFTHPKIEDVPKVKQAELISLITGLHQKNIKTNIQKLDKSVSVNGTNYQKDIDKINKILDDLT